MSGEKAHDDMVLHSSDGELRAWLDLYLESLESLAGEDLRRNDDLSREVKRLNRELLSLKRSLGLMKKEREHMRTILRSLENRLLTISGKTDDTDSAEKI